MHLSNTMLDVLGTAPVEAVIIYTWSRVLHMRNRAAFYLLMSSCMLVVVLTRGDAGTGMRFAYLVFTGGVLPFLMADERPARKVFVIALMNVGNHDRRSAGDGVVVRHDGNRHHRLRQYAGASRRVRDYARGPSRLDDSAVRRAAPRSTTRRVCGIDEFAAVPLVSGRAGSSADGSPDCRVYARLGSSMLFYGMSVLAIGCFVVDAMLFASMDRYARKRHEDQRAALLQGQLDACLAQCNAFVLEVEQTARMRHDVRNQAHAAMVLAERGDYARARDHISSFRSLYLPK